MYCPHCSKFINEVDPEFCPSCGQNLKKPKSKTKPIYKNGWFIVITICVFVCVAGAVANYINNIEITEELVPDSIKSETSSTFSKDPDLDDLLQAISPLAAYDNLSMTQVDNQVVVSYWFDGLSNTVASAKDWNSDKIDSWKKYVLNEQSVCNTLVSILRDQGFSHSVVWNVLDDTNKDSILLSIIDGEVVYDSAYLTTGEIESNGNNLSKKEETTRPTMVQRQLTVGEQNAIEAAEDYLNFSAFSYEGLIEQLEYEGYTSKEAAYAVDHCFVDWYDQAEKCAKSYLRHSSFSYTGLLEQLEYELFTHEQAKHAVDSCGADWYEQAALTAKSYLRHSSFSRDGLIEQLEYEGFTYDQAVYGAQSVGY